MALPGSLEHQIVKVARMMLSGEVGVIDGCRRLVQLSSRLGAIDNQLFSTIVAVESETEDVPIGQARLEWSKQALTKKDEEVGRYLRQVHGRVMEVCEAIMGRYSDLAR